MEDCIFCKIIKGEIPSNTLFEDDIVKVIMDINPVTTGHCMVIPKEHYTNLYDLPTEVTTHVFEVARRVMKKQQEALGAEGVTLAQNNGLGQDVKHYHLHLVPRYNDDGFIFNADKTKNKPIDEAFEKIKL